MGGGKEFDWVWPVSTRFTDGMNVGWWGKNRGIIDDGFGLRVWIGQFLDGGAT